MKLPSVTLRAPAWPVYLVALLVWLTIILFSTPLMFLLTVGLDILMDPAQSAPFWQDASAYFEAKLTNGASGIVLGVTASSLTLGVAALLLASRNTEPGSAWTRRLRLVRPRLVDAVLTILGFLAFTLALNGLLTLFEFEGMGALGELRSRFLRVEGSERLVLALLVGVGPGVAEELFFRGYMLTRLELARGRGHAVFFSSLVFGLFHLDVLHSFLAALMGLYLGSCVLLSGSLVGAIAAHILNNSLTVLLVEAEVGQPASIAVIVLGLLVALASVLLLRHRHPDEPSTPLW